MTSDALHVDAIEEEENDSRKDFLSSYRSAISDSDDDDQAETNSHKAGLQKCHSQYNSRKPKWWKQVAGKPTKAQKRFIVAMQDYRLPKVEWGEKLDWKTVFSLRNTSKDDSLEIWLEIGFGQGDNLLALAQRHPKRCFIGAEVHQPSLGKAFQRIHQAVVTTSEFWTDYDLVPVADINNGREETESPSLHNNSLYNNLRLHGGDGVKLLPHIPTNSLAAVLVTFPDPFPKNSHEEFRVLQRQTLQEIHRVLDNQRGRLFLATDHEAHYQWCHAMVDGVNQEYRAKLNNNNNGNGNEGSEKDNNDALLFCGIPVPDRSEWLPVISKYERKGWEEGRQSWLSCWETRPQA